jgi:hypothetical protein
VIEVAAMKPGYATSEFALTLVIVLVAGAAVLMQVYRGQLDAAGAVTVLAAAAASMGYAHSRSRLKEDARDPGSTPGA